MFETEFKTLCENAAKDEPLFDSGFSVTPKEAVYSMVRRVITVELVLRRSAAAGMVNNILYCRIYPNKNRNVFYLLPEIFTEMDIDEYRSCFFPMIETAERLEACFNAHWALLKQYLPQIEDAADEGLLPYDLKPTEDDTVEHKRIASSEQLFSLEPFVITDYTIGAPNKALLTGDRAKTIRLIDKARAKGRTLEYQNRLSDFLKTCGDDFKPMPDECNALLDEAKAKKGVFGVYAAAFLVCWLGLSAVFMAMHLIFNGLFTAGCVAVFGPPWYFFLMLTLMPAFCGMLFFRKRLVSLIAPKRAHILNNIDRIQNGRGVNAFAGGFALLLLVASVILFFVISTESVRVYEDRFDYVKHGSLTEREEYRFEDIEKVYRVSARYNIYGDRIERASYVAVMKDGRHFDFDGSSDMERTEKELLPMLKALGIPIGEVDSERDIPAVPQQ